MSKHTPGAEFDKYRDAIRAAGHRVNPYRIGIQVGLAGDKIPNPYAPRSCGERDYNEGIKYGRQRADELRRKARAALLKASPDNEGSL